MRNGAKAAIVGGVFAVMVGGAGYGAYNIVSAVSGDGGSAGTTAEKKTGPPSGDEVEEASEKFFAAWKKGDAATAAAETNNAQAAKPLLVAYGGQAHITKVKITPGTCGGHDRALLGGGDGVVRGEEQAPRVRERTDRRAREDHGQGAGRLAMRPSCTRS